MHKTRDLKDLLQESAISIVGTQNLPHMILQGCLWLPNVLCCHEMYLTPAVSDFGVKNYEIVRFL